MLIPSLAQADGFLIAYTACLQEVRKTFDSPTVAPGATLLSALEPSHVAKIAQLLVKILAASDSPINVTVKEQVRVITLHPAALCS